MASVAGLGVGLGNNAASEEVNDRAFSRTGPTDDADMQRLGGLTFEERSDRIPGQCRGQTQYARLRCEIALLEAMILQPA